MVYVYTPVARVQRPNDPRNHVVFAVRISDREKVETDSDSPRESETNGRLPRVLSKANLGHVVMVT